MQLGSLDVTLEEEGGGGRTTDSSRINYEHINPDFSQAGIVSVPLLNTSGNANFRRVARGSEKQNTRYRSVRTGSQTGCWVSSLTQK